MYGRKDGDDAQNPIVVGDAAARNLKQTTGEKQTGQEPLGLYLCLVLGMNNARPRHTNPPADFNQSGSAYAYIPQPYRLQTHTGI
jgi:hypothetical protein